MTSEWVTSTLGEVAEVVSGGTPSTKEPTYWGGDQLWLTPSEVTPRDGETISSTARTITDEGLSHSSATVVPAGAVLVTSRATVGAVALAGRPLSTNQGFAALVSKGAILPRFLMLWVQSHRDEFTSRASGSTFPEISRTKVRTIPICFPDLATQRRIVDLVAAVNLQIDNLSVEASAAEAMLESYLTALESELASEPTTTLGAVATIRSGPSWAAADESSEAVSGGTPVIKITNTRPGGRLELDALAYVSSLPASTATLGPCDLILIRTNGNRGRIGNVYLPGPDADGCAVSAFQFLLRSNDPLERRFIYWWLRRPTVQAAMSQAASGSTGLGNLAVRWLKALKLPWPSPERMAEVAAVCDSVASSIESLRDERAQLSDLRDRLLADLMNRDIELPVSYDEFLDGAA